MQKPYIYIYIYVCVCVRVRVRVRVRVCIQSVLKRSLQIWKPI
jgi:hypothetical protein